MSEHILLTGGTGFVGRSLIPKLLLGGHTVTVLTRQQKPDLKEVKVIHRLPQGTKADYWPYTVVVNLAGENLFTKRWSTKQKQTIRDSRIALTENLVDNIHKSQCVKRFISASAIGYYGARDNETLNEQGQAGSDFAATLCKDWEAAAQKASVSTDVICLRLGVVLGSGGALENLLPPFRLGIGGPIGHGKQWFSWIHIDDLTNLIMACVEGQISAPVVNATAPQPVQNRDFAKALGHCLKRPAILPMPALAMKLLLGEVSSLLTTGQRVIPEVAQAQGFSFRYPDIDSALTDLLEKRK